MAVPCGRFTLPKSALIRRPAEYQRVYREGKRIRGENFALVYRQVKPRMAQPDSSLSQSTAGESRGAPVTESARLGISVSGIKSAVRRNRIKRIIREYFRLNRSALPQGLEIVFTVRRGFLLDSPDEIARALAALAEKKPGLAWLGLTLTAGRQG